jgi:hypothetical protein
MAVDFFEAINLFKYTRTGQGSPNVGKGRPQLPLDVINTLWHLRGCGRIWFADLGPTLNGLSNPDAGWIKVNRRYQDDLAVTSLVLCHEGVHCARPWPLIDEELQCQYLQLSFYEELRQGQGNAQAGVSIGLRTTGTRVRASVNPALDVGGYETRRARNAEKHLIDAILTGPSYEAEGRSYRIADTLDAAWVRRHVHDWGDLGNRWPETKALYLHRLSNDPAGEDGNTNLMNASIILDIVDTIPTPTDWTIAMIQFGTFGETRSDPIRRALAQSIANDNPHRPRRLAGAQTFRQQVQAAEQRLQADLGAGGYGTPLR